MAIKFGFYDSVNGDRTYNAATFSIPISHIIEDGVFADYGDRFLVTPASTGGLNVTVGTGASWWAGTWTQNDAPITPLALAAADTANPRIDRVVVRHDSRPSSRSNTIIVITGTPAATPTPPTLSSTTGVSDMVLADVRVPTNATGIAPANVTNRVGTALTPYVTAPLTSLNLDPVVSDLQQSFNDWFNNVQGQLNGDVAGNLANRVTSLENTDATTKKTTDSINKQLALLTVDTGWVTVPVLSDWKTTGEFSARVIGGRLYFAGIFARAVSMSTGLTSGQQIAVWPDKIKTALVNAGWSSAYRAVGHANSTLGTYATLGASSSGMWLQYRNRNPGVGENLSGHITGAVL